MVDWTPEMKTAAMADAQKVCDQEKRIAELEDLQNETILHLRNVLYAISDMDEGSMCGAISHALDFYNGERPTDLVVFKNITAR